MLVELVYLLLISANIGFFEEYCISDSFHPKCLKNEVIIIQEALFGRQKYGKCLKHKGGSDQNEVDDPKVMGCYANIKLIIGSKCDGRQSCEVPIAKIEEETPCNSDLKHYLEASYVCLKEYCNSETFNPKCRRNEVILIQSASYGRKNIGKCMLDEEKPDESLLKNSGYVGCYADISYLIEPRCGGEQTCSVAVAGIKAKTPCRNFFKSYLEVDYVCVEVIPETHDCKVSVESDKQHISSVQGSSCGGKTRPWKISSMAGQRINISLLQLKSDSYDQQLPKKSLYFMQGMANGKPPCHVYAVIREESSRRNVLVCYDSRHSDPNNYDGGEGVMHHVSGGNEVEVYFEQPQSKDENRTTFLLSLEANGCTDLMVPEDAYWKRNGSTAVVGCYVNRFRWTLTCDGKEWSGVVGNCSHAGVNSHLTAEVKEKTPAKAEKESMLVPIVAIIMAGLVFCFCIICVGVVLLNRYYAMNKKMAKQMSVGANPVYNNNSYIMQTANKAYYEAQMRNNNNMSHNASMDKQEEGFFAENSQLNQDTAQYFELDQALVGKEAPAMA